MVKEGRGRERKERDEGREVISNDIKNQLK